MKKTAFAHFVRNNIRSVSSRNRINFFRQMAILTKAGISLLDALKMLGRSAKGPIKKLISDTIEIIEQGSDFSTIGKYYIKFFDKTMSSMIEAGENTGTLPGTMQQIFENLKRSSEFSRKIRGALVMPLATFILAIGVLFFMSLYVVPNFSTFLSSMGAELPPLTRGIVDFSDFVIAKWKDMLIYSVAVIGVFLILNTLIGSFRYLMHKIYLKIPLVGSIILYSTLSNFANAMAKLLGSGVGVADSIKIAKDTSNLLPFKRVVQKSIGVVMAGGDISTSFEKTSFIPSIFSDLLKSGEASGTLDHTFEQLSSIYREEVDYKASALQTAIQPIMTILIGGIVGVIAGGLIMGMVALWAQQGV